MDHRWLKKNLKASMTSLVKKNFNDFGRLFRLLFQSGGLHPLKLTWCDKAIYSRNIKKFIVIERARIGRGCCFLFNLGSDCNSRDFFFVRNWRMKVINNWLSLLHKNCRVIIRYRGLKVQLHLRNYLKMGIQNWSAENRFSSARISSALNCKADWKECT